MIADPISIKRVPSKEAATVLSLFHDAQHAIRHVGVEASRWQPKRKHQQNVMMNEGKDSLSLDVVAKEYANPQVREWIAAQPKFHVMSGHLQGAEVVSVKSLTQCMLGKNDYSAAFTNRANTLGLPVVYINQLSLADRSLVGTTRTFYTTQSAELMLSMMVKEKRAVIPERVSEEQAYINRAQSQIEELTFGQFFVLCEQPALAVAIIGRYLEHQSSSRDIYGKDIQYLGKLMVGLIHELKGEGGTLLPVMAQEKMSEYPDALTLRYLLGTLRYPELSPKGMVISNSHQYLDAQMESIWRETENFTVGHLFKESTAETVPEGNNAQKSAGQKMDEKEEVKEQVAVLEDDYEYYRQLMGGHTFLDKDQEFALSQMMENAEIARYFAFHNTSLDELGKLYGIIAQGKDALQLLIRFNAKLVMSIVRQRKNEHVPRVDLIQESNVKALQVSDNFDWRKGNRYSTLITYGIRHQINMAVENLSRDIPLRQRILEQVRKVEEAESQAQQMDLSDEPLDETIATLTDLPVAKVRRLRRINKIPLELDHPISTGEEGDTFGDMVEEDDREALPEEEVDHRELGKIIQEALVNVVSEKEADVIRRRLGMGPYTDQGPCTLEEVGDQLDLTRERVRQIWQKGIDKIKISSYYAKLALFFSAVERPAPQRDEEDDFDDDDDDE